LGIKKPGFTEINKNTRVNFQNTHFNRTNLNTFMFSFFLTIKELRVIKRVKAEGLSLTEYLHVN